MIEFTRIMKRSRGVIDIEMINSNDFGIMGGWSLHCKGLSNRDTLICSLNRVEINLSM